MPKGWKITSVTTRLGGAPLKEYFIVALEDRHEAVRVLRERKNLVDADITVIGEVSAKQLDWLDVRGGEIFSVLAIS
jgi:hypothetical protein